MELTKKKNRLFERTVWPNEWHPKQCRNCVMQVFHSSPRPISWQLRPWNDPFVRRIIRERINALRYQPYSASR